jgi:hypothetical protein
MAIERVTRAKSQLVFAEQDFNEAKEEAEKLGVKS